MSTATTCSLASNLAASTYGQAVGFTAALAWSAGTGGSPIGTMTFKDGITVLGTAPVNASGQASLSLAGLAAGTHFVTAEYSGDASFTVSTSAARTLTVAQATTTTALATSPPFAGEGSPLNLVADVLLVQGTGTVFAAGTVTFKDGITTIGTAALNAAGRATLSTSALVVGTHALTAVYGGNGNAAGSSSSAVSAVVMAATTVDLPAFEDSLHAWVKAAVGIETIWAHANAVAPPAPYAWITLAGPVNIGEPQYPVNTNLANPAGQEIERTVIQHGEWAFTVDVISPVTSGIGTAKALLSAAAMRLQLPSATDGVRAVGLAVVDVGDTQDLTALFNSTFESRARLNVRLRSVNTAMEKTGYITKVGLSSPFGTWPQLPP